MSLESQKRRRVKRQGEHVLAIVRGLQVDRTSPVTIARVRREGASVSAIWRAIDLKLIYAFSSSPERIRILKTIDDGAAIRGALMSAIKGSLLSSDGLLIWARPISP